MDSWLTDRPILQLILSFYATPLWQTNHAKFHIWKPFINVVFKVIRSPADPSLSQRQALEVSWRTYSNIYRKKEKKNGTEEINVEVIHVLFC